MVSIDQIERGITAYLDSELAGSFPEGTLQRAIMAGSIAFGVKRLGNKIRRIQQDKVSQFLDLFDSEGNFDIEGYCECLKPTIPESGVRYEHQIIGGITITRDDVDKIKTFILDQKEA